ncbi:MAG: sensor histidine kinase, partial [Lishizhenia sp.]
LKPGIALQRRLFRISSSLIYNFRVKISRFSPDSLSLVESKSALEKAILFAKKNKDFGLVGEAYSAKAKLYLNEGLFDKAEISCLAAYDYYVKAEDTMRFSKVQTNLGIISFALGKLSESKRFFNSSLMYSINQKDVPGIQNAYANLGEYFLSLDILDSASFYINRVNEICEIYSLRTASINTLSMLVKLEEKKGNLSRALDYQKRLTKVQEEVIHDEVNLATVELNKLFEESTSLDKMDYVEGLLLDVEKKNSSLIKLIIVCGIFFILLILIVYVAYRQQNKLNKALMVQRTSIFQKNTLIDQALKEKEILLKEIHHRVKNNLQIISSLLNLQSRTISDEKALRALSEGRARIQAIALLHQKLYQNETFSTINIDDYLNDLTTNLRHTLVSPEQIINIKIVSKDIILNLDTAVPLGLIISELVTNSLKHAFKGREEGEIVIEVNKAFKNKFVLEIYDNGIGLPVHFKIPMEGSLGTEIIEALSEQLEGTLSYERHKPGAYFQLYFEEVSVD